MRYNEYASVTARGELGARSALLTARLESPIYRPDVIFGIEQAGWPGDWEGRTILALTCQASVSKREMSYLDEIVRQLPEHFNSRGYLGPVYDGALNEQQLSGHSWLLRGLCEYYIYREKAETLKLVDGIVKGLYLPAAGRYKDYPLDKARRSGGDMSGSTSGLVGDWYISTDTGCAYIPLDGLTQAYLLLSSVMPDEKRDKALAELIEEMIYHFIRIPFVELRLQTHATLSGTRGLLRWASAKNDEALINSARRIFDTYEKYGMTKTYANKNWFGRPEWTEPCAVIDSFMVCSSLFALTDDPHYAELSQLILYNGIYHSQRNNGGFGCDSCASDGVLRPHCYEAYWCCTMRGGEGLAAAAKHAVTDDGVIIDPISVDTRVNGKRLSIVSGYPQNGNMRIYYEGGGRLYLFVPRWLTSVKCEYITGCDEHYVYIDAPDSEITLQLDLALWNDGTHVYFGPRMLCADKDIKIRFGDVRRQGGEISASGERLGFIDKTYLKTEAEIMAEASYTELL